MQVYLKEEAIRFCMTSIEKNVKSILVQLVIKDNLSLTVEINGGKNMTHKCPWPFFMNRE